MESAEGQKASTMAVAIENGTVKKIFRARKTMTASCRQQIATLHKQKRSSKIETLVQESAVLTKENVQQHQTEFVLVKKCITQNTSSERENQSQSSSNGFKTSEEGSPDDSGLKAEHTLKGMLKGWRKNCEHSVSGVVTPFGSPAKFSNITDDVTRNTKKAHFNDSMPVSLQNLENNSLKTNIDNCFPVSKALNESSTLRTKDDGFLMMNSATGLVNLLDVLATESTNATVPSNESNVSCDTPGTSESVVPNVPMNLHVDSASLDPSKAVTYGDSQKKRSFSEDADIPEAKRSKTENKSFLDEIDNLIQRRIHTVFKESFDQRIQDLSKQINLIQCKEDNAKILARHLESLRRLRRHLNRAFQVQNEAGMQTTKSIDSTSKELPKTVAANPPAEETSTSHTKYDSMQNLSTDCSNPVVLSDNETEQKSDQGQSEHRKNPSKKVNHSAIHKIMESIKEHRNRTLASRMDKQHMAVIDLTDDEEQKADKDATYPSPSQTTSSSPTPYQEDRKDGNIPEKCSEQKEELSENNKKRHSSDSTSKTSSVQKSLSTHGSVTYLDILPNPDLQIRKPPQKPELRLAQVQNPKGIALSWNITHADPSCAPAQVYCLYVHQENQNNLKKLWKKIGEIKALPLPMACTLTQFVDDATYSFVLRAKDAGGRFGPLCDIQSTTLKSLNMSKKT